MSSWISQQCLSIVYTLSSLQYVIYNPPFFHKSRITFIAFF